MKEFELKYGCNPNQSVAKIFMKNDYGCPNFRAASFDFSM